MNDTTDHNATDTALSGVSFDHVAIAVARITDPWPLLADVLGGRYADRGINAEFGWTQLRFANGFVVEGLHPEGDQPDSFLRRYLDRFGPGPHHLTFTVPDLDAALRRVRAVGLEPVGEDRSDPAWAEAFLRPDDAHGIVVQIAQVGEQPITPPPEPEGFPELPFDQPVAALGRVVHAVRDLDGALRLFRDVLGGSVVSSGAAIDGNHWAELSWGGAGHLRLLEATHAGRVADWLDGRPGRLRHLFFSFDNPSWVPGAQEHARGRWVVEADDNVLGTRLVIASTTAHTTRGERN
ncbi:MAG: VOC family protein [Actinomycetes bacterium]